jgi:serine/threonine protein kinase
VIERRHSADSPDVSAHVGETFGRYRLLGLLGQGGMGRLYVAERRGIQGFVKIVALKQILPHLADSAQLKEMFLNEARIAARLEHPNIVATYELGEVDGKYFISMEYLPGEDLSAIIGRCQTGRQIPAEIAAALAQQAAQGLHYAHEARDGQGKSIGLVHRDVNPRNIFVTYHGVVKLLDFGVVRGPQGHKSVPGVFKGKYGYCAPEQLEGGRVDRRTDVFCLGIALWESLTGARLFDAGSDATTIDAVRSRKIEAPSSVRADSPAALDTIVLRALARDPAQRYQSAHDMSEDLDRFLLDCASRPTTKALGRWLETTFGADRAALKKAISQGGEAESALERLTALDAAASRPATGEVSGSAGGRTSKPQPRAMWSTSFGESGEPRPSGSQTRASGSGRMSEAQQLAADTVKSTRRTGSLSAQPAAPAAKGRTPLLTIVVLAVAAGLIVGGIVLRTDKSGTETPVVAASATATLEIKTEPPGAHVFVDGSPSGLLTPAVLKGLPVGRTVKLSLDKQGYETFSQEARLQEGQAQTLSLTLRQAQGTVRLTGVPRNATAYLDDRPIETDKPFSATPGAHRLRVEAADGVVFSNSIDVTMGAEVVVDVARDRSKQ